MIDTVLAAAQANLLAPAVLFFVLGAAAGALKSDLDIPDQAAKALALYLMLSIGFKGGIEARDSGLNGDFLTAGGLGLAFSFLTPFAAYVVLRRACKLDSITAASTAAHYGSVSLVTFAAGTEYLRAIGVEFSGHMTAVLALMETPAILAALLIARRPARTAASQMHTPLWREVLLNGAAVLLIGAFLVGLATGARGETQLAGFVSGAVFYGALCFFLLDMGLVASRKLSQSRQLKLPAIGFAVAWPALNGALGVSAASALGLSLGDATLFGVLAGSASYIAAPAAMRVALPKADAGVSLPMALAITFPFNLLAGIPFYHMLARSFTG